TLGSRAVEVAEDPWVMRGQLSLDALLVERLEQPLRRLAQRPGLADQHGHRLARAPSPQQRAPDGVVAVRREVREVPPEPRPIVAERMLDRLLVARHAPAPSERHLTELRERFVGPRDPLLGRAGPPPDGQRAIELDAAARGVAGP